MEYGLICDALSKSDGVEDMFLCHSFIGSDEGREVSDLSPWRRFDGEEKTYLMESAIHCLRVSPPIIDWLIQWIHSLCEESLEYIPEFVCKEEKTCPGTFSDQLDTIHHLAIDQLDGFPSESVAPQ